METARISIRRLTVGLVLLLVMVMILATVSGTLVLRQNYRTAEGRFEVEARETLQQGAISVRNQIVFFDRILSLLARNPHLAELMEGGSAGELQAWATQTAQMLPGALGTALARPDGEIVGDAVQQRVGKQCRIDLARFLDDRPVRSPPVHLAPPGLEHFDLVTRITTDEGTTLGALFVSFRLGVLQQLLDDIAAPGKRFVLRDANGRLLGANPPLTGEHDLLQFSTRVPHTDWDLTLELAHQNPLAFYAPLLLTDLAALGLVALFISLTVRRVMTLFRADISRIHRALLDVHNGVFSPSKAPPAIRETAQLLPDIEALAAQLQERQSQLEQESVTDALTGVHNRRYFDLMLVHDFEQSTRQQPSFLAIIDIDDFKSVNDRHGHAAGDAVLAQAGDFLRRQVRASDTVARLGGDEFALLLHNMCPQSLEDWVRQMLKEFDRDARTNQFGDCGVAPCTLSVGIAAVDATHFASAKEALIAADRAMYRAKQAKGRESRAYFSDPREDRLAAG